MKREVTYGKIIKELVIGDHNNNVAFVPGVNCKSIVEVEEDLGDAILLWYEVVTMDGGVQRYNATKVYSVTLY